VAVDQRRRDGTGTGVYRDADRNGLGWCGDGHERRRHGRDADGQWQKTTLTTSTAFSYASTTEPGRNISVLISDKAPQNRVFRERMIFGPGEKLVPGLFEGAWKSMHFEKAFEGLSVTFGPDKRLLTNEVLVGGLNKTFSLSSYDLTLDLKEFGPRISGSIRTSSPVEAGGLTCAFDVTFDAAVVDFK